MHVMTDFNQEPNDMDNAIEVGKRYIFANMGFFAKLHDATGPLAEELRKSSPYREFLSTITHIVESIQKKDMTLGQFTSLKNYLQKPNVIMYLVKLYGKGEDCYRRINRALDDVDTLQNEMKTKLQKIEELFNFVLICLGPEQSSCIVSSNSYLSVQKCKAHLDSGTIHITNLAKKPSRFEPLWSPAEEIVNLRSSKVFTKICQSNLKEGTFNNISDIAGVMTKECVREYKRFCEKLMSNDNITVQYITHIFPPSENIPEEIEMVEKYLQKRLPAHVKTALKAVTKLKDMKSLVENAEIVANLFNIDKDKAFREAIEVAKKYSVMDHSLNATIFTIKDALDKITEVTGNMGPDATKLLEALAKSCQLVNFLKSVIGEDLRNLIDVVEDMSEDNLRSSTVLNLIKLHSLVKSLLSVKHQSAVKFFHKLESLITDDKNVLHGLEECNNHVHSLKNLYKYVENRGEVTWKTISSALENMAQIKLDIKENKHTVEVEMKLEGSESLYLQNQLEDLLRRAHLMYNVDRTVMMKDGSVGKLDQKDIKRFIDLMHNAMECRKLLQMLHDHGHFEYRYQKHNYINFSDNKETKFDRMVEELKTYHDEWMDIIENARSDNFYLNFVYGEQMWTLWEFFTQGVNMLEASKVLKSICPQVDIQKIKKSQKKVMTRNMKVKEKIIHLGKTLEKVIPSDYIKRELISPGTQIEDKFARVTDNSVYVVQLQPESKNVHSTILSLYYNNTHRLPEPWELMLCHENSTWEEIKLLLKRCSGAHHNQREECLFCLANVEFISGYAVMKLIGELKKMEEASRKKMLSFRLAVVCRGANHHELFNNFPNNTHHIAGLTDHQMISCLESISGKHCPDVEVVTSDLPGIGKTEYISKKAVGETQLMLFQVCGPITKEYLVLKLSDLQIISQKCLLHMDIGQVTNPELLDNFIFELVVLGQATFGTKIVQLYTRSVAIEIANTLHHDLKNSLNFASRLRQTHINCTESLPEILFSGKEKSSPIQVTCQYLKALKQGHLDATDIVLDDPALEPITAKEAKQLLQTHLGIHRDMSFTTINIFLNVLGLQLKKLSTSIYFRTDNLKEMLNTKEPIQVKSIIVHCLIESCKEFANRSVVSCRSMQEAALNAKQNLQKKENTNEMEEDAIVELNPLTELMTKRTEGMLRWETSNHFMILFNRDGQSVTALYRHLEKVPQQVKKLFGKQLQKPEQLPDFQNLDQKDLLKILKQLIPTQSLVMSGNVAVSTLYSLTPDNLHKMILILLRIQGDIPVIIMGETGCGKTSLVRYLAAECGVDLKIVCLHAGFSEDEICRKTLQIHKEMLKDPTKTTWIFFDEVNACVHLGLLSNIICHRTCNGTLLAENMFFLAACNPYRLRENPIFTAGLKNKTKEDEYSKLVYRVYPLPEAMTDYVWDYGILHEGDERKYIEQMVAKVMLPEDNPENKFEDIIIYSQTFLRQVERTGECVSLRDVDRCLSLTHWFLTEMLPTSDKNLDQKLAKSRQLIPYWKRAIILSLAHCYHSRINTREQRTIYLHNVAKRLNGNDENNDIAITVLKNEQRDLLNRMELPGGIAQNTALRENVFVSFVCIMKCIPVFLVGKPGSSKSLSLQLLKSNLRGRDSHDPYFKTLPQIFVVPYQGSESSTSEGIIKAFKKAENYKRDDKLDKVLPVVLLDEVGLAEKSKFNPLKVLHNCLEPVSGQPPTVAVVGISNWALDAAKMNRAIYLSRPDLDKEDLYETAKSISIGPYPSNIEITGSSGQDAEKQWFDHDLLLKTLSGVFFEYQNTQRIPSFHGLRDYYGLIKYICKIIRQRQDKNDGSLFQKASVTNLTAEGILRNFGGIRRKENEMLLKATASFDSLSDIGLKDLICSNLEDKDARHLMIITKGDSAMGILQNVIQEQCRSCETIIGSKFEEDLTADYSYRILSRIILVMERDCVLIMKDLENIYGSLYDMLNQSYTVVGGKKNCRIALGTHSNSMCGIHENFRCIVLVDETRVCYADPPFLNRFEKQIVTYDDVLTDEQKRLTKDLYSWVCTFSSIENSCFKPEDCFVGFHSDTLPTLVLQNSRSNKVETDTRYIVKKCQDQLLWTANPSAIVRIHKTSLPPREVKEIKEKYFSMPQHQGLYGFLCYLEAENVKQLKDIQNAMEGEQRKSTLGYRVVVHTSSHLTVSLEKTFTNKITQTEKLNSFKTERELTTQIKHFFSSKGTELLLLHCKPSIDSEHMHMAMYQIDNLRAEFIDSGSNICSERKNVCILVHVDCSSEQPHNGWQFNYLSGWEIATIDDLQPLEKQTVPEILEQSPTEVLQASKTEITSYIKEHIFWAFTFLKSHNYHQHPDKLKKCVENILNPEQKELIECLSQWIESALGASFSNQLDGETSHDEESWHVSVSCDPKCLTHSTTFQKMTLHFIEWQIKTFLAKLVYKLEYMCAWDSFFMGNEEIRGVWKNILLESDKFLLKLDAVNEPHGLECYEINEEPVTLMLPFSRILFEKVRYYKKIFKEDVITKSMEPSNVDDYRELLPGELAKLTQKYAEHIEPFMNKLYPNDIIETYGDYLIKDLCNIMTRNQGAQLPEDLTTRVALWILNTKTKDTTTHMTSGKRVVHVLTTLWTNEDLIGDVIQLLKFCHQITSDTMTFLPCGKYEELFEKDVMPDTECSDKKADGMDPEDVFVSKLCKDLLPTQEILEKLNGIPKWQVSVNRLLSFSSQVSCLPSHLHALRLCNDFATMMAERENFEEILIQIGKFCLEENLDSKKLFEYLKKEAESSTSFQCQYFRRILDSNPNSCLHDAILNSIVSLLQKAKSDPPFVSPVLQCFIAVEEDPGRLFDEYDEFLRNKNIQEYPTIAALEQCFEHNQHSAKELLVICSDLIQDTVYSNIVERLAHTEDGSKKLIETFDVAMGLLQTLQTANFQVAVASAFVRSFLTELSLKVVESPLQLSPLKNLKLFVDTIGNNLTWQGDKNDSDCRKILQAYLIKTIQQKKQLNMCSLVQKMHEIELYLPVTNAFDTHLQEIILTVGYNPLSLCEHYSEIKETIKSVLKGSDTGEKLKDYVEQTTNPGEFQLAFMASAIEIFFLPSINGTLNSDEMRIRDQIISLFEKTEDQAFNEMMACLTRAEDFKSKAMKDIILHSEAGVQKVTAILCLASLLITKRDTNLSFLGKCLLEPNSLRQEFVPTCTENNKDGLRCQSSIMSLLSETYLVKLKSKELSPDSSNEDRHHLNLRYCVERVDTNKFDSLSKETDLRKLETATPEKGYQNVPIHISRDPHKSIRKMSPLAFRVLRILMHGMFLCGVGLERVTLEDMTKFIGPCCQSKSVDEYLVDHINNDWEMLRRMLDYTNDEVFHTVTYLVWELHEIFFEKTEFQSRDQRIKFEDQMTKIMMEKFQEYNIREFLSNVANKVKYSCDGIESMMLELKIVQDKIKPRLPLLCLFRELRPKSIAHITTKLFQCNDSEFPFLRLCVEFSEILPLIRCILPILKWHKKMMTWGNRMIKQQDAERLTIDKFLHVDDKFSEDLKIQSDRDTERADRHKLFEDLTYAWDKILKNKSSTNINNIINMEKIQETDNICNVLLHTDESQPMKILKILLEIQNDFLDAALRIATSTNTPALGFLIVEKGTTQLPIIPLQNAQEHDERAIIDMSEEKKTRITKVLQNGEWGLQYGKGKGITYDFSKIEKDLANLLLLGKTYLQIDDSFPKFTYADELSLSNPKFLHEISSKIKQMPLTEDMWKDVTRVISNQRFPEDLLHALDIIIFTVRRNDTRTDEPMDAFIQKWLSGSMYSQSNSILSDLAKGQLQLSHIVALYEYLEKGIGMKYHKILPAKFCSPIPENLIKRLGDLKQEQDWRDLQRVEALETSLLRHIYRIYASNMESKLDELQSIGKVFEHHIMWPHISTGTGEEKRLCRINLKTLIESLPRSLTMQYLQSTLYFVQEIIKEFRSEKVETIVEPRKIPPRRKKQAVSIT